MHLTYLRFTLHQLFNWFQDRGSVSSLTLWNCHGEGRTLEGEVQERGSDVFPSNQSRMLLHTELWTQLELSWLDWSLQGRIKTAWNYTPQPPKVLHVQVMILICLKTFIFMVTVQINQFLAAYSDFTPDCRCVIIFSRLRPAGRQSEIITHTSGRLLLKITQWAKTWTAASSSTVRQEACCYSSLLL